MRSPTWLVISVGLNLCALAAVAYLVRSRPQPLETVKVVRLPTNSAFIQTGAETLGTRRPSRIKAEAFHWNSVESDDYPTYITNLRAIGCPEETIRDIVTADVNKLYAQRRDALAATPEPFKFWQTDDQRRTTPDLAREQQLRDLEKERRALLRKLLGEQAKISVQDMQRLAYLPEDKRQTVAAILARYRDLVDNLRLEGPEFLKSEAGQAQLAQYQDQQRAELLQSLTPQELEEYDLRNSEAAKQMRHELVGFNPSEQEFRTIYRLRQKFADAFSEVSPDDQAAIARRNQAREEFETSLKPILSASRFADYQRSKDAAFRELTVFAQHQSLPRQTVITTYDMQRLAEQQALKVSRNENLSAEQRAAAMEAIRAETEKSLKTALGATAYAAYFPSGIAWASDAAAAATAPPLPPLPAGLDTAQAGLTSAPVTGQGGMTYGVGTPSGSTNSLRRYYIRPRTPPPTPIELPQ